jgi:hypothetical protein
MSSDADRPSRGVGCLLPLLLLPVVVIVGVVVGTLLSQPDDPEDEAVAVTLEEGTDDGVSWRVDAVRDVEGETCAFLFEDGSTVPLNGACTFDPQDVTYGTRTVVFGRAEEGQTVVRVVLDDGQEVEVDTVAAGGLDGRFFVTIVPGDVDAESVEPA